jgi:hypothetical protein
MKQFVLIFLLQPYFIFAQIGGTGIFKFLNTAPNARSAAYGGTSMVTWANDLNVAFQNPSLLQPTMHNQATVNYLLYPAGITAGSVAYAFHNDSVGTMMFGVQYYNYGTFTRADETGEKQGIFRAADYSFQAGINHKRKHWYYGTNLKFVYSSIESYNSYGIAADIAATYHYSDTSRFVASFLIRNIGVQIDQYAHKREHFPLQIQIGLSKQLAHMPFRYFLVFNNLQKLDVSYINFNSPSNRIDISTGETIVKKPNLADKAMRHILLGGEFLFTKTFNLRFGYNYQHRKELILGDEYKKGLAGFSWGLGLRISKLQLSYGGACYIPGVVNTNFSIVTQFSDWKKKTNPASK